MPSYPPRLADRTLSATTRHRLIAVGAAVWLLLLGGGAVTGYAVAGNFNRVGAALLGLTAGAIVFFVLTWIVIIYVGTKKDPRAVTPPQR